MADRRMGSSSEEGITASASRPDTDCPYRVLGLQPPLCLGRERVIRQLCRKLSPPNREHISLVGPKYIGKTVVIREVIRHFSEDPSRGFAACVFWDLHHNTPRDDEEFFHALADVLRAELLRAERSEVADYLEAFTTLDSGGRQEALRCVFEHMEASDEALLLAMDGMDAILASDAVTTQLWEFLRALAQMGSLRFLTGSRHRLQEICRGERARTSNFWNIFDDPPTTLSPFGTDDWDSVLEPFSARGLAFSQGARTEVRNWTGGVPVLTASLCRRIWEERPDGDALDNTDINSIASGLLGDEPQCLRDLWEDCTLEEQYDLAGITEGGTAGAPRNDFDASRLKRLEGRGFVGSTGGAGRVAISCRFIGDSAKAQYNQAAGVQRLFGTAQDFERNLRAVLALRRSSLPVIDLVIDTNLKTMIENLNSPEFVLQQVRGLSSHALTLVLMKDLPDGTIPADWVSDWYWNNPSPGNPVPIPNEEGRRCEVLRHLTDGRKRGESHVSRATYCLIQHLHNVGNLGQHNSGENIEAGFAASVCFDALQLTLQLSEELK